MRMVHAPNARVEICFGKKTYELARVSQSGVVGWLYIEVGDVIFDPQNNFTKSKEIC